MVNSTIINATYDLTNIINASAIEDPPFWLASVNEAVGGYIIFTLLAVFTVILFLEARKNENVSDTEAAVYSGLIASIVGTLLFVVDITAMPGVKILQWTHLLPFIVLTGVSIVANYFNRKFI